MTRATMDIRGMSCGHCLNAVSRALNTLDGVKVEQVRIGSATLEYDPGRVTPDAIRDAVADAGYDATVTPGADDVIPSASEGSARPSTDSSLRSE